MAEFGDLQKRVERGKWITTPPACVEIPAQKNDGQSILESGGSAGGSRSGGGNLGHQQKMKDEKNLDVDPRLRVMEIFR